MRVCRGSFTIESAYIFPLVMLCICLAINAGIEMHETIKTQVEEQAEEKPVDVILCMYRREFVKELLGKWYED